MPSMPTFDLTCALSWSASARFNTGPTRTRVRVPLSVRDRFGEGAETGGAELVAQRVGIGRLAEGGELHGEAGAGGGGGLRRGGRRLAGVVGAGFAATAAASWPRGFGGFAARAWPARACRRRHRASPRCAPTSSRTCAARRRAASASARVAIRPDAHALHGLAVDGRRFAVAGQLRGAQRGDERCRPTATVEKLPKFTA